ncbi:galectin-8-like [Littorina saxatilis]|uniref:galectin-8-like n=1 Tax=Littorina saxatilis TaxID=31220 RepID=UPI0038B69DE8
MGRVTCHDDFINTNGDVIVRCLADGTWETEGNCLQRVWRNPPLSVFPVAVPLPVGPGLSVCMEGTPTAPTSFTVDLLTGSGDIALHADFRFNFSGTTNAYYLDYRLNGSYTGGQEFRPFFFTVGVPFSLMIYTTATKFRISVGNIVYAWYPHHAKLPPADVKAVDITNGVNVTRLDVLCNN